MKVAVSTRTSVVFKHTSAREKYFVQCSIRSGGGGESWRSHCRADIANTGVVTVRKPVYALSRLTIAVGVVIVVLLLIILVLLISLAK